MGWALEHVTQEWDAFMSAPVLCLFFLVIGGFLIWWINRREVLGLRAENLAIKQRLSLAKEQEQAATKIAFDTKDTILLLSKQVASKAPQIEIAATVASVGISMDELIRAPRRGSQTIRA